MATVRELRGGDKISIGADKAVLIGAFPHPVWEPALLTVWRMDSDDSVHVSALMASDEMGDVEPIEPGARAARLMDAVATADEVMRFAVGLRRRGAPRVP